MKINFNTQLIAKIAGGIFTVLGLSLLAGNDLYQKKQEMIHLTENDISVDDSDEVAKETSD